jgi:hypothetical protein
MASFSDAIFAAFLIAIGAALSGYGVYNSRKIDGTPLIFTVGGVAVFWYGLYFFFKVLGWEI